MATTKDRVQLNVGGKIFETTISTLAKAGRDSILCAHLDKNWNLQTPHFKSKYSYFDYFIDRSPACFGILLNLLRTGELHPPPNIPEKLLYVEASFYGLLDHVRAAKWGQLDGNRLQLAGSVSGRAAGDPTAIRAGPDAGCCVAHGSMVHVYDWMLNEQCPINLDYLKVSDVGYVDSENIVITASEDPGGMGLFSSSTGELKHRFQVALDNQVKSFTTEALTFGSSKILAICKTRCDKYGIGVWDPITGNQIDFVDRQPFPSFVDVSKLQWLDGKNCLMLTAMSLKKYYYDICLLDLREKDVVWSWGSASVSPSHDGGREVLDATAMEDNNSICAVNQYDELGYMDVRGSYGDLFCWNSENRLMRGRVLNGEACNPKLVAHGGKVFASLTDRISVFSGPQAVLTSSLQRSYGGSICDFSIGGDRLFALHSDENVFDIWETPRLTNNFAFTQRKNVVNDSQERKRRVV